VADFLETIVAKAVGGDGTALDTEAMIKNAEVYSSQAVETIVIPETQTQPGQPEVGAAAADKVAAYSSNAISNMQNPMRSRTQVSPYRFCVVSSTI
jgi:mono/diheme cytochrome c family protein